METGSPRGCDPKKKHIVPEDGGNWLEGEGGAHEKTRYEPVLFCGLLISNKNSTHGIFGDDNMILIVH